MKKALSFIIVLLLVAGAAAYYFLVLKKPGALGDLKAAEYLPSETMALVEVTDLPRTRERWKQTAFYKIWQEPSVQAFMEKPKTLVPHNDETDAWMQKLQKADPKEIFIAAAGIVDGEPKLVAGFDFKGSRQDVEALVNDLKSEYKKSYPTGKTDIEKSGSDEIETFTFGKDVIASVFHDRWFFIATDLDLLKSTLARVDGKADVKTSLRENDVYKASLAKLPKDSDGVLFVQMKPVLDPLMPQLVMLDAKQIDELKKIESISAAFKLDGANFRDAFYVYKPGGQAQPPLAFNSMGYTDATTVLYAATALNLDKAPLIPNPAMDKTGMLALLEAFRQPLAAAGLGFDDFKAAFGPEIGIMLDWPAGAQKPSPVIALDVRDKDKAAKFTDTLTAGAASAGGAPKQVIDGTQFYTVPVGYGISAVIALTDKTLLFGMDKDALQSAVAAAKTTDGKLDKQATYQTASGLVDKPTNAFGYVDSRVFFERVYGVATTFLKMAAFFNPDMGKYGDLNKLPPAEDISKHLDPVAYSQATDENGTLIESTGPVTFTQMAVVLGAAGVFYGKNQMLDQSSHTQAFPGGIPQPVNPPPNSVNPPSAPDAQPAPANP